MVTVPAPHLESGTRTSSHHPTILQRSSLNVQVPGAEVGWGWGMRAGWRNIWRFLEKEVSSLSVEAFKQNHIGEASVVVRLPGRTHPPCSSLGTSALD